MEKGELLKIFAFIIVCQLAGIIGSVFTFSSIDIWYASLQRPSFSPPNWIFGPVWLTLYTMMGVSAYLIWKKGWKNKEVQKSLYIFSIQLILNSIWSFLFFGLNNLLLALFEIIILWVFIILTIFKFYKIDKSSAWLLVPYLLWVSFAMILNYYFWMLNV
jgi:benzodiazapine receptor